MPFSPDDVSDLLRLIARDAGLRAELRTLLVGEDAVTSRLDRLEAAVEGLAEAQKRTEERLEELAQAQKSLAEAQKKTEDEVARLVRVLTTLDTRVGRMDGSLLEIEYERKAHAYFGRILRRTRVVPVSSLLDDLEKTLDDDEVADVLLLDLLVAGRPRTATVEGEVFIAIEISSVIDRGDVDRAERRAALLRRAGYAAVPLVAGRGTTDGAEQAASQQGVAILHEGKVDLWEKALRRLGER